MKRSLALVLSVVLVLTMMLSFASCSGDTGMSQGYYAIINAQIDGKDYPSGDPLTNLQKDVLELDNLYVKLMADGQGEMCIGGNIYPLTYDDKQITVQGESMTYTYAEGIITLNDVPVVVDKADAKAVVELKYVADVDGNV